MGVPRKVPCYIRAVEVSFVDYDLDEDHIAGVLNYDPPEDVSVAARWNCKHQTLVLGFYHPST